MSLMEQQLMRHEGIRYKPYRCTAGKLTIGVGHNLDDKPLSHRAVQVIFEDDVADVIDELNRTMPWYSSMNEARKAVLINMCFNLGINRLMKFKKALDAMKEKKWHIAADEMLDSLWAKQVGSRATELAKQMKEGEFQ